MQMRAKGLVLALVTLMCMGCASGEINRLRAEWRKSQEQIADLKARLVEKDEQIRAMQAAGPTQDPDTIARLQAALAERDRMAAALAAAEGRIRDMSRVQPAMLPPELDQALIELARSNPELMEYDPQLGMVRFRSDFTFSLGSTSVRPTAVESLNRLATIIRSPIAAPYEVVIVGHTDNVPIHKVKDLHPTNWHLSVHRAIAVKDVLYESGVPNERIAVKGYGEFRPVAPNGAKGAEANRRVEIFLVASTAAGAPAPAAPTAAAPAAAPRTNDAQFK